MTWFNNQLYAILSLLCKDDALQVVKKLREQPDVRGFKAWHQLTREVASKSGVRLERLSDRVHHPKPMKGYADGLAALAKWTEDVRELEKMGQTVAEITKRTALKSILPVDLQHDMEKDSALKTFASSWKYALEQIPIRKEWKQRRGKDDMDVDAAEAEEPEASAEYRDAQAPGDQEDPEANVMKGGGKGQFQGFWAFFAFLAFFNARIPDDDRRRRRRLQCS